MRELTSLVDERRSAAVLAMPLPGHSSAVLADELVWRMRPFVRTDDFVCVLEDGELAVILRDIGDRSSAIGTAQRLFQRCELLQWLGSTGTNRVASFGIVMLPSDLGDAEGIWRRAQRAARYANRTQARWVCWSDSQQNVETTLMSREESLAADVLQGIERGEFELHYQPQIETSSGHLRGLEALVRWRRDGALVMPGDFIPAVEAAGMSVPLGSWVLGEACRQVRAWRDQGLTVPCMAVNVSAQQLRQDFVPIVQDVLQRNALTPQDLEIELTESADVADPEEADAVTNELASLGVSFSLDDFGTGYSSFMRLKSGPFKAVKIERRFVSSMLTDTFDREMLRAIINFGRRVGIQTIAEGVETSEQLQALQELGCESWQGYLYSRPLPADGIVKYLTASPAN